MANHAELSADFIERNRLVANGDFNGIASLNSQPKDRRVYIFDSQDDALSHENIEGELVITLDDNSWIKTVVKSENELTLKHFKKLRKPIESIIQNIQE